MIIHTLTQSLHIIIHSGAAETQFQFSRALCILHVLSESKVHGEGFGVFGSALCRISEPEL